MNTDINNGMKTLLFKKIICFIHIYLGQCGKSQKKIGGSTFYGGKTVFFRAKNFNESTN